MMFWLVLTVVIAGIGFGWAFASPEAKEAAAAMLETTREFWGAALYFLRGGSFTSCEYFEASMRARVHVFGMCLHILLWSESHYRHGTFKDDLQKNLRNVAVPKTGVPLSVFAVARPFAIVFLFVLYPLACLAAALHAAGRNASRVQEEYKKQLLTPTDWFSFWRLNCALASLHSLKTKEEAYELEDKLKFLLTAEEKKIAVSPIMDTPAIICKHRNEEGGLGYQFYSNALNGGDWIIQEVLKNEEPIKSLLPDNSPLSTFRVITISTLEKNEIIPLSCVWRAGLAGAQTDHSAILFDVDVENNVFKRGTTNSHWYRLGWRAFGAGWTSEHNISEHPDNMKKIEEEKINAQEIMLFAKNAHESMMPKIPIVGWDVALTNKGMLLLECNLSCNFFLGSFDLEKYTEFVASYFSMLSSS